MRPATVITLLVLVLLMFGATIIQFASQPENDQMQTSIDLDR